MKLAWNDQAFQTSSICAGDCPGRSPRFNKPDLFTTLTALSFPDLSTATDADNKVSVSRNFRSLRAKVGCKHSCLPALQAAIMQRYPLSKIFKKRYDLSSNLIFLGKILLQFKNIRILLIMRITSCCYPQRSNSKPLAELLKYSTLRTVLSITH